MTARWNTRRRITMSDLKPEMHVWTLRLWPIGAIHVAVTRSQSGASLVLGIFIWKLALHVSIAALD
jgi:hypothetical protein